MKIFVSYTVRDGAIILTHLRDIERYVMRFGVPYIDLFHNRSENAQEMVMKSLYQSSVVCLCVTPALMQSVWVRMEIMMANLLRIPIITLNLMAGNLDWRWIQDEIFHAVLYSKKKGLESRILMQFPYKPCDEVFNEQKRTIWHPTNFQRSLKFMGYLNKPNRFDLKG